MWNAGARHILMDDDDDTPVDPATLAEQSQNLPVKLFRHLMR